MYLYSYENLVRASKTEKGKQYVEELKKCYEKNYKNRPIEALSFSKFKLFHVNGDRTQYQKEYFDRRNRLNVLQVLAISDDKYIEPLEDVISAICDEITWCLPAHCLIGETGNTYRYDELDLNASETAMFLAEISYVFGDRLSPDISNRIKYCLEERVVKTFENGVFPVDRMSNNWASVCGCGIGLTYLYAFPERFLLVKDRIFSAMERYLNRLDSDGYCSEGYAYWIYGFGFFALFFDVYCQLKNERPLILERSVVKNTIKYAESMILGDGVYVPIADGALSSSACEDDSIPVVNNLFNANVKINGGKIGILCNKALSFRRLYFINQEVNDKLIGERSLFFENSQVLVGKRKNYIFISKGGNNAEMHNHNDIGSFSIFKNGVQYIVDPGAGEYTNGYFNSHAVRYSESTFTCCSLGHSVPIVDGGIQVFGKQYYATVIDRNKDYIFYDITHAYPNEVDSLTVKYSLKENGVNASYSCKGLKKNITFRFITFIEPKIVGNDVLIGDMTVTASKVENVSVKSYEFSNHQAVKTTAYAIDYTFKDKADVNAEFNFDF